jgi:hypothetical protein
MALSAYGIFSSADPFWKARRYLYISNIGPKDSLMNLYKRLIDISSPLAMIFNKHEEKIHFHSDKLDSEEIIESENSIIVKQPVYVIPEGIDGGIIDIWRIQFNRNRYVTAIDKIIETIQTGTVMPLTDRTLLELDK